MSKFGPILEQLKDKSKEYQDILSEEKRKEWGQVYTPEIIAKLMVELTISKSDAQILDPASGCGILLKSAHNKLLELNPSKIECLNQVWGVEINKYPAQISKEFISSSSIVIGDFFQLKEESTAKNSLPEKFDYIIANPPYIKQEKIPNKKNLLAFLKSQSTQTIPFELTAKTDYYGFFLWYSAHFLKKEGLLCFLIPNKWLDVQYGEKIKKFLLETFEIIAILGFEKNIFHEAIQVSSVILICKIQPNKTKRDNCITRFINLSNLAGIKSIQSIYDSIYSQINLDNGNYIFQNKTSINCTLIHQNNLNFKDKWSYAYIYQSKFLKLLVEKRESLPFISLDNTKITKVIGGIKTGANEFFFPSKTLISQFNIPNIYLKSGIKSGRDIPPHLIIKESHISQNFFSIPNGITEKSVHEEVTEFLNWGLIEKEYPKRPSVKWKPWYSIPEKSQDCPDILFLRHIDKEFTAKWNKCGAIVADGIRGIKIVDFSKDEKEKYQKILFYLGVLNSSFFYWQAHIRGRWEGQGDLQLLVYELKSFEIPNYNSISSEKIQTVNTLMEQLISSGKQIKVINSEFKKKIDLAVLESLNLKQYYELLVDDLHVLETLRISKIKKKNT